MNVKHWNAISRMVYSGVVAVGPGSVIEDIGRKKVDNKVVHEFMIDNELYRIERVEL